MKWYKLSSSLDDAKAHWESNKELLFDDYREPLENGRWLELDGIPHLISPGGGEAVHFTPFGKGLSMGQGYSSPAARNEGLKSFPEGQQFVRPKTTGYYDKPDENKVKEFVNKLFAIRRVYQRNSEEDEPRARMKRDRAIRALEAEFQDVTGTKEMKNEIGKRISDFFKQEIQPETENQDKKPWEINPDFWKG